jgi:hypothetical protein
MRIVNSRARKVMNSRKRKVINTGIVGGKIMNNKSFSACATTSILKKQRLNILNLVRLPTLIYQEPVEMSEFN